MGEWPPFPEPDGRPPSIEECEAWERATLAFLDEHEQDEIIYWISQCPASPGPLRVVAIAIFLDSIDILNDHGLLDAEAFAYRSIEYLSRGAAEE